MMTETNAAEETQVLANAKAQERAQFIGDLRKLASFLEAHPDVPHPICVDINVYASTKEEVARAARAASWEKEYTDSWLTLSRVIGPNLMLRVFTDRSNVCRRVVTGTRVVAARPASPERVEEVVEWICDDPLLAGERS